MPASWTHPQIACSEDQQGMLRIRAWYAEQTKTGEGHAKPQSGVSKYQKIRR
jgi:hypothetical protein